MLFEVKMASHKHNFKDYGLKDYGVDYEGVWHETWSDCLDDDDYAEICYHSSVIEINTLEDLLKFQKKCKDRIIVEKCYDKYAPFKSKYSHCIIIYNDWME